MSGWDVSSTPKWGPQDGPEETQAFPGQGDGPRDFGQDFGAQDFGRGGPGSPPAGFPEVGGGYPGESAAGGPPPEFFGPEYGQDHEIGPGGFPQRTPGRSFEDLPQRESPGRHSSAPGGGYGQDNGYGADSAYGREPGGYGHETGGYGHETGYGQDSGFGQGNGFGPDSGFGQGNGFGPDSGFGQDNPFGQDSAFGQDWGGGGNEAPDAWGAGGGQQGDGGWGRGAGRSVAPWEERPQQDAGYPGPDGQQDFGQQDFGRQDYARQPRPDYGAPDYGAQDYDGQQGSGPQESFGFDRGDRDMAARMDPALQDFFAPQRGGAPGYPGQGPRRSGDRDSRYRPPTDGWENPGHSRTGTGPRPASRGPRRDRDDEPRRGLGMKGLIAVGVVVAVIIVAGVVLLTHKSGGSPPTASNTPAGGGAAAPAAKPTATGKGPAGSASGTGTSGTGTSGGAGSAAYTLSTPSTAGGYPLGQDPNFLGMATGTAKQISDAMTAGGGGTVKGDAVSGAYQLPAAQVITFVGYQGTFTPGKVQTVLASLGTDPNTYSAGPNGGVLGCANTKSTPSGAICVWATASTLGVTEFFDSNGPETLNASQSKGATDTVKLRADVEKKATSG